MCVITSHLPLPAQDGKPPLERTLSPVSALEGPYGGACSPGVCTSERAEHRHGVRQDAAASLEPAETAPTLQQPHLLLPAQRLLPLLHGQPSQQPEQPRKPEHEQLAVALLVGVGAWTPQRRRLYAAAAASGGRFACVRPDECPQLAASFEAEAGAVVRLLERQPCSTLHFDVPDGAASGRHTTNAMHAALQSWRFEQLQARHLEELAVHGWLATREVCVALPTACPHLRRLLLSGCAMRLDLSPLWQLSRLHSLALHTDLLEPVHLAALPASLRRLELEVAGVGARCAARRGGGPVLGLEAGSVSCSVRGTWRCRGAVLRCSVVACNATPLCMLGQTAPPSPARPCTPCRVGLPPHLQLDLLSVSCPNGRIFAPAPALLRQCRQVQLECGTAVLMGLVSETKGLWDAA